MAQPLSVDTSESPSADSWLPVLLLLFVGSGAAALIYEIVWFQMLELYVGSSAVSVGVLLGTFMGGMCLGSLFLPRLISPRHHPLRVYAMLELGIGAIGLILLFVMPLVGRVYLSWGGYGITGSSHALEALTRNRHGYRISAHGEPAHCLRTPAALVHLVQEGVADQRHRFGPARGQSGIDINVAFLARSQHEVAETNRFTPE